MEIFDLLNFRYLFGYYKFEDGELTVKGLDCLNKTQLIDIKPAIYQEFKPVNKY